MPGTICGGENVIVCKETDKIISNLVSDVKEINMGLKWLDKVVMKGFIEKIAFQQESAVNIVKS